MSESFEAGETLAIRIKQRFPNAMGTHDLTSFWKRVS